MAIETSILEIIEGKKKAPIAKALLRVVSEGYRSGVALRNFAYDRGLAKTKLEAPVISIGNVVAGGSGKTPFVQFLAESLSPKNIVILSTGYKRKSKKLVFVKESTSYEECGDEPLLLAKKLPQSTVVVHSDRSFAGWAAQTTLHPDFFLLDDGMQYRKLHRDYEVVVMDAENLFGKGHFLPRGLLRDSPKRLANAHLIVLNGIKSEEHYKEIELQIRTYATAPIVCMQKVVENQIELASKKVASFCAIGSPIRFQNTLKSLGCDVVMKQENADHAPFSVDELERLANLAKIEGAECLVCTEKDVVKLPSNLLLPLPIIAVRIRLKPMIGKEHLISFIKEVSP